MHAGASNSSPGRGLHVPLATFCIFYFLSGFSALVYQTSWQRMLGLFGGSDAIAASLVVGAFLTGLGLGSLVGASIADRLSARSAVLWFAACEFGIAAFAAASPFLFYDVLFVRWIGLAQSSGLGLLAAFIALLPPTLLMGMSMPLLSRAIVTSIDEASSRIGWLYGLNTVGAALGTLAAGFLLIGTYGYEVTVYIAGLVNLAIGLAALAARPASGATVAAAPRERRKWIDVTPEVWRWSGIAMASGFIIVALEIVWFRALGLLMKSDAYAFSVVLFVFLVADGLGIVFGSLVIRRITQPGRWFGLLQGGIACCAVVAMAGLYLGHAWLGLDAAFTGAGHLGASVSQAKVVSRMTVYFALTMLVVGPSAFLAGLSFPVIQRAVHDNPHLVGQRVGLIQLANILGNAAGALVTGLVLLHWLGTAGTLRLVAVAGLAFLFFMLSRGEARGAARPVRRRLPELGLAAVTIAAVALFPPNAGFWATLHGAAANAGTTLVEEDRTGVAVLVPKNGLHALYIAGHDQSQVPFSRAHGALGVLGPLVHPNPESVLLIGSGTGGTPYASGINPQTKQIRVVEIVAPVFRVMDRFARDVPGTAVTRLNEDARIERVIADARHVLFTDDRVYDLIQADAIYPWSSHAGLLYSVEFFRQVRSRLKPGGICVQWVPTPRTLATFLEVFPYVVQVNAALIGSDRPVIVDREAIAQQLRGPARPYLDAGGWDAERIIEWIDGEPRSFWSPASRWRQAGRVNSDLFPRDEYFLNANKRDVLPLRRSEGPAPGPAAAVSRRVPTISASPNPVLPGAGHGETTIRWDAGDEGPVRLLMSTNAGAPAVVADGSSGAAAAPGIQYGFTYEFRLVRSDSEDALASVIVTRQGDDTAVVQILLRLFAGVALLVMVVILTGRRIGRNGGLG